MIRWSAVGLVLVAWCVPAEAAPPNIVFIWGVPSNDILKAIRGDS